MRLMVPPLPAASRPRTGSPRWPVALTQACSEQLDLQRVSAFRNCAAACGGGRDRCPRASPRPARRPDCGGRQACTFTSSKARCTARASSGDSSSITRARSCLAGAGGLVAAGDVGQHGGRLLAGGVLALGDAAAQLGGGLVGRSARAGRRRAASAPPLRAGARGAAATGSARGALRSRPPCPIRWMAWSCLSWSWSAARGGPRAANSRPRPARKNGNPNPLAAGPV